MVAFYLVFITIICLYAGFYSVMREKEEEEAIQGTPFERGAVELPAFARTRDEDKCLRKELADLLRRRKGLEKTWEQGALMRGNSVLAAGDRWILAVRLQKNVYAAALMATLCRLCPEGLPDDEADFWEKGFLSLMDEGEGYFLLGLSYLYLYETFAAENEAVTLDAWRRAIVHFRRSATAGHIDGMAAACLLARIGHDLPFTPPAHLPKPLPVPRKHTYTSADLDPEVRYWRYRLAEYEPAFARILGRQYLEQKNPGKARAEYWLRQAVEYGDHLAAYILFENYHKGRLPDKDGRSAALYLIFFICQKGFLHFGRPLTLDEVKETATKLPLDAGVRSELAAHWDEGMAFHKNLLEANRKRHRAAEERLARCYAQARENLAALIEQAGERLLQPRAAASRKDGPEAAERPS